MKKLLQAAMLALAALAGASAQAAYPERPITIVVPYTPGGAADALARMLAHRLSTKLRASVIVDNRAGASGTIGEAYVARAEPDGYTVLYDATPYSINPSLYPKLPFSEKSFLPLSLVALTPNVLVVRADSAFKTEKDLFNRAKAEPGKVSFGTGGSGTVQRLATDLLRQRMQLDMLHVPYKSGSLAINDVMGGQVDFMLATITATYPLIKAGKLRALAITSDKRSPLLPEVPTLAESGLPGYEAYEWNGVLVPAGTPPAILAQLHGALVEVLKEDEVRKRFEDLGARAVGSTPNEFKAFLVKEEKKWADVVRQGNIKLE